MTKIDIISGFLGAGKTTLIKKLIDQGFKNEKLVLIENEFGEIGIDGGFLKDAGVEINEMNSGCICCSLVGDFGKALHQVLEDYTPDRIIIEPSGVGKLSDVIKAVEQVLVPGKVELNSLVAVVDALKCKMYMKNFGEFFNNQVESAKTIILSRTKNQPQDKLEATVALLREHNEKATIITTDWNDIDGKQIVEAMEHGDTVIEDIMAELDICPTCGGHHDHHHHEDGEECCCGYHHDHDHEEHHHHHEDEEECCCGHHHDHDHHHHHADDVFTSWGVETVKKYSEDDMKAILDKLANTEAYGKILRAKGIVQNEAGEWINFDLVPGEYEVRKGNADYTGKLCVIGSELNEEKITQLFNL